MTVRSEVYFGASDGQMETYIDQQAFKEALVYGILFHGDLVIIDIFFFISAHFEYLILDNPQASRFILTGISSGAIIPDFRTEGTLNFSQNLTEIQQSGIQGLRKRAPEIASKIDRALEGRRLMMKFWPARPVSVGFKETIDRTLFSSEILTHFPEFELTWSETSAVRDDLSNKIGVDGIGGYRRGDIYNEIFKIFNKTAFRVNDVRQIWANLPSKSETEKAKKIVKWINYCYYYNQGRLFGLSPSFSAMTEDDTFFAKYLTKFNDSNFAVEPIVKEHRLPSASGLLRIDPKILFDIRNSSSGESYFAAVEKWRLNPTEETAGTLLDALSHYISKINSAYMVHGGHAYNLDWYLKVYIPPSKSKWGQLGVETFRFAVRKLATSVIPIVGVSAIVGQTAALTYETLPAVVRDKIGPPIGEKIKIQFDFETAARHLNLTDKGKTEASFGKF